MSKIDFTDELKNFVKERGEVTYEEVKIFTENKKHKVEALRACADLWDHELVGDTKDLQEATRRLIVQKLSKLKDGNVLSFPR